MLRSWSANHRPRSTPSSGSFQFFVDFRSQCHYFVQETAENELKKLRQGLGFKARPMPGFYRRTDPPQNEIKKVFFFPFMDKMG